MFMNTRSKKQEKVFGTAFQDVRTLKFGKPNRGRRDNLEDEFHDEIEMEPRGTETPSSERQTPRAEDQSAIKRDNDKPSCGERMRRFAARFFAGAISGDEGEQDDDAQTADTKDSEKTETFAPWINKITYTIATIWALGCMMLILVYSLQFDLSTEPIFFYNNCGTESSQISEDFQDITKWVFSISLANLMDFFLNQPVTLFLLSLVAVIKGTKKDKKGEYAAATQVREEVPLDDDDEKGTESDSSSSIAGDEILSYELGEAGPRARPTKQQRGRSSASNSLSQSSSRSSASSPMDRSHEDDSGSSSSRSDARVSRAETPRIDNV